MHGSPFLVTAALLLTGCMMPILFDGPYDATVLRLEFTLTNDSGEGLTSTAGGHCATVRIQDDMAVLGIYPDQDRPSDGPFVLIDPELEGTWDTTGTQPIWKPLPHSVDPGIYAEDTPVAELDWQDGQVIVDGVAVEFPYSWTVQDPEGQWHADATLSEGPDQVQYERLGMCE